MGLHTEQEGLKSINPLLVLSYSVTHHFRNINRAKILFKKVEVFHSKANQLQKKKHNFASMFELTRHIESLLLRNDCVIVPYLGGFVTCYRPARYVEEENLYLPPTRSVSFNARLTINDGLLTQSYMQANDISFPDAQKLVEQDVAHVKEVLQQEGEFTFDGIGKLLMRLDGHYDFVPLEAGVVSPGLYGLDAVEAALLHDAHPARNRRSSLWKRRHQTDKFRARTRKVGKRIGRVAFQAAAVAVVAFALYFAWATPAYLSPGQTSTQATMAGNILFDTPSAASSQASGTHIRPTVSENAEAVATNAPTDETTRLTEETNRLTETAVSPTVAEEEAATPTVQPAESGYTLVLASAISLKNAENYVQDLKQRGYEEAAVYQKRNMTRVICGRYATEKEARHALNRLNDQSEFADAWIMPIK